MAYGTASDSRDRTLYVSSIHDKVTKNLLYELFLQCGPVANVSLVEKERSHRIAFVEFKHEESVPYTIELMQGVQLFGKALQLKPRENSNTARRMAETAHMAQVDNHLRSRREAEALDSQAAHLQMTAGSLFDWAPPYPGPPFMQHMPPQPLLGMAMSSNPYGEAFCPVPPDIDFLDAPPPPPRRRSRFMDEYGEPAGPDGPQRAMMPPPPPRRMRAPAQVHRTASFFEHPQSHSAPRHESADNRYAPYDRRDRNRRGFRGHDRSQTAG